MGSVDDKLADILPRLHGTAGEFAYGKMPRGTSNNIQPYWQNWTTADLQSSRGEKGVFASSCQKPGETVGDY